MKKHRTYIKSLSFHRAVNFRDMRQADVLVHMQTMRANVLLCRKLKRKGYSCGVQLGASYVAKNIPHVPYEQRNKEMYPIIQARSTLLEDLLGVCGKPVSGICERGIEAGVFETGMVLVNHRFNTV